MKTLHILDASTDIKAVAFRMSELSGPDAPIVREAGFRPDEHDHVVLIHLTSMKAAHDPFDWEDWTMRAAHLYLVENFDTVRRGGSIDVEQLRLQLIGDAG